MSGKLVECVPNVSEGRDPRVIERITEAVRGTAGVSLLHVDPGKETNRTVITFVGPPDAALEAAFALVRRTAELVDMRRHRGAHPRIGATDVCPFVPVAGVTMEECAALARTLGARVGSELGIPVYLYERAASSPARENLADIRKGEYEGLEDKLRDPSWAPDFGPSRFDESVARSGATVVGARPFLIAYNVNLNTRDKRIASDIALTIREGGRARRDAAGEILRHPDGTPVKEPGMFRCVKAVGWYIPEYQRAQISINLTDFEVTPPHEVFDACRRLAAGKGARVTGSELVGLVPRGAILAAGRHYLRAQGRSEGVAEGELVETAIQSLGLRDISPFDPAQKVIEYVVGALDGDLVRRTLRGFADELSSDSPAPGGGSVAALMGSLSAALAAMVANLTVGRKGYEDVSPELSALAVEAQALKDAFLADIDRDTDAFNRVMEASRLPRASDAERLARDATLHDAYGAATRVPLEVLVRCARAVELAAVAARKGNRNSLSDAGVAAVAARAAGDGAFLNVLVNLPNLPPAERDEIRAAADAALAAAREGATRLASEVEASLRA